MSQGLNKVMLLGNLGADPELRLTQGGQSVCNIRMATSETYLDRNNVRQERTTWHRVTIWGRRGEALAKILGKGDRVFIEGRIETSSYEKNGEKRYATSIVAANVILCGNTQRPRGQIPSSQSDAQEPPEAPYDDGPAAPGPAASDDDIPF